MQTSNQVDPDIWYNERETETSKKKNSCLPQDVELAQNTESVYARHTLQSIQGI